MSKLKFFLQQSWLVIVASLMFGLLLAVAKAGLQPRIDANEAKALSDKMTELISDANHFDPVQMGLEIPTKKGKALKADVYQAIDAQGQALGYAFTAIGSGFADKIKLVIAVDAQFETLLGYRVLASNETPGFGDKIAKPFYQDQFVGAPVTKLELLKVGDAATIDDKIISISGATVSSDAVVNIFNSYILSVKDQIAKD